jgi:hypothetical protein
MGTYHRTWLSHDTCLPHSNDVSIDMVRGSKDMINVRMNRINVYLDTANASPYIVKVSLDMII